MAHSRAGQGLLPISFSFRAVRIESKPREGGVRCPGEQSKSKVERTRMCPNVRDDGAVASLQITLQIRQTPAAKDRERGRTREIQNQQDTEKASSSRITAHGSFSGHLVDGCTSLD